MLRWWRADSRAIDPQEACTRPAHGRRNPSPRDRRTHRHPRRTLPAAQAAGNRGADVFGRDVSVWTELATSCDQGDGGGGQAAIAPGPPLHLPVASDLTQTYQHRTSQRLSVCFLPCFEKIYRRVPKARFHLFRRGGRIRAGSRAGEAQSRVYGGPASTQPRPRLSDERTSFSASISALSLSVTLSMTP